MSDKRPLIFIKPYSETLQKLLEVCNEIKVQEGFEVFEIDSGAEFAQVVVSAGASLTLFSSPKKCALILQEQKRNIFKMKSKVMLLSAKNIDRKIHEKFTKMGLSELVVEPIAPKTLVHKVKLLLRSLPKAQVEGEADNQMVKSMEDGAAPEPVDNATKSDGGKYNKIDGFMATKTKDKKMQLQLSDDEDEKPMEESVNYAEEALAKKRKTYTEEELQDIEKSSKGTGVADKIDGFFRNKKSTDFQLTDEEETKREKKEALELESIEKKRNSKLSLEEEISERKKSTRLDMEEDDVENDKRPSLEKLEKEEKEKNMELLLQDDEENKKRSTLDTIDDEEAKKKSSLDLLLSEDKSTKEKADILAVKEDESKAGKKKDLRLEEEAHEREKKEAITKEEKERKSTLDLGLKDDAEDESKEKTPAEFVDKFYRNNELQKNNEEDGPGREKAVAQIKLEKEKKEREKLNSMPIEEDDATKESLTKLKLSNEVEENPDATVEVELEQEKEREKAQLKLEMEKEELEKKESNLEEDASELDKKATLNLSDDDDSDKASPLEKENNKKARKDGVNLDMDKDDLDRQGNHGKVDHIDTHYGMKHADRKVDQNWDKLGDTDNVSSLAEAKKRKEVQARAFDFDVKKDDGFNYENVEKDFSDVDPFFRNLKNKYGSIDYENNIAIDKEGNKRPLDEALEAIIAENLKLMGTAVENLETDEVFLVSPLGITGMIEASNYYHNKKKKGSDLLKYLAQKILDDYGAATTFILYDLKNKTQKNWYCGHIELDLPKTNRGDRDKHWQAIFNDHQKVWKATNEVTTSEQFLIYPLQEGITTLGLGVVEFLAPVDENKIIGIQNILSCALGLYYQEYHASIAKKEVVQKVEETTSTTGSGFFNKVFGFFKNKAS